MTHCFLQLPPEGEQKETFFFLLILSLWCPVTQGIDLKLHQGNSHWIVGKHSLPRVVVKHWNKLCREVVEASSKSGFKKCLDNTQVSGLTFRLPCAELGAGLDPPGSFPTQDIVLFYDNMNGIMY